jgi:hypothetical protein
MGRDIRCATVSGGRTGSSCCPSMMGAEARLLYTFRKSIAGNRRWRKSRIDNPRPGSVYVIAIFLPVTRRCRSISVGDGENPKIPQSEVKQN